MSVKGSVNLYRGQDFNTTGQMMAEANERRLESEGIKDPFGRDWAPNALPQPAGFESSLSSCEEEGVGRYAFSAGKRQFVLVVLDDDLYVEETTEKETKRYEIRLFKRGWREKISFSRDPSFKKDVIKINLSILTKKARAAVKKKYRQLQNTKEQHTPQHRMGTFERFSKNPLKTLCNFFYKSIWTRVASFFSFIFSALLRRKSD